MKDAGTNRLLRDIDAVGRMLDDHRPPAQERLRALIGDAFADRLVSALTAGPHVSADDEGREIA